MMRIETAREGTEGWHDDLALRGDEAAARHASAFDVEPQFGMKMAGNFGAAFVPNRFVAKNYSGNLHFLRDPAAAVIGKARIVIAHDPCPVEP